MAYEWPARGTPSGAGGPEATVNGRVVNERKKTSSSFSFAVAKNRERAFDKGFIRQAEPPLKGILFSLLYFLYVLLRRKKKGRERDARVLGI